MQRPPYLLALTAIVLWSFLAYVGAVFTRLPSLLVVGVALLIGGLVGLPGWRQWRVPLPTLLVGVGGIGGYHVLYFAAFQRAPAVEVNLINYLWPLLIVLLSPLVLPGYRLRLHHLAGAGMGLLGAGLIVSGGQLAPDWEALPGYALALAAALTWALYSLFTRRLPPFPTQAVSVFCLLSGLLALAAFALSGEGLGRIAAWQPGDSWLLLLAGAGPMGAAFYAWDAALKRGDLRIIGALSYLTPLLSTLNLVLLGGRSLTALTALAMALIIGGALLGAAELFKPGEAPHPGS